MTTSSDYEPNSEIRLSVLARFERAEALALLCATSSPDANLFRFARKALGLTVEELASVTGLNDTTIRLAEKGSVNRIGRSRLYLSLIGLLTLRNR